MIISKGTALEVLAPEAEYSIDGGTITWLSPDIQQPTSEAIEAEMDRQRSEYQRSQYQRQRAPEYPSMAELADALYWNSTGDSTKLDEYYAACAAVKAKYPKPEVN
jgi:hypothetical protein